MTKKRYEIAETPKGMGKVYRGDDWLADVRYGLLVEQEFTIVRHFLGTRERPGPKVVMGQITVVEGERPLMKELGPYTLLLEDGRRWAFDISGESWQAGTFRVSDAGGEGLIGGSGAGSEAGVVADGVGGYAVSVGEGELGW